MKRRIPTFLSMLLSTSALAQVNTNGVVAEFAEGLLRVPALGIDGDYYGATFALGGDETPVLILQDVTTRAAPLTTTLAASFADNRLSIPCLKLDQSYYQVSMNLSRLQPQVLFDDIEATPVAACDSDLPGHLTFMSPHSNPILVNKGLVYVANTPAASVDVIDADSKAIMARIPVGIDPVALAVRPDGMELWVSNHISDTVSVINTDSASTAYHQVTATIQNIDATTRATQFDEPVGIAFASNDKAYVALSSSDRIAVVDVASRSVSKYLTVSAQDPRAIIVAGNRLYVTAFESNNQSELSGCFGTIDGDQCTFSLLEHVVNNNNVLSLNYDADIVKDSRVPDRDLFVYDITTDTLIQTVSTIGTLLYGITADSSGTVFIAQTDARNTANGRAGSLKQTLADLENRAFLNQIGVVDCSGASCAEPTVYELEPLPPQHPAPGTALATPFAIQISADDSTLVATAAGSGKLFTVDAASGMVLGSVQVGAVPHGIALESGDGGVPGRAWVLNAVDNSVAVVDLTSVSDPLLLDTIQLDDPTDPILKLGRAAFSNANGSSTGTFSCESCHPDGHTDQLLWVLGGPQCQIAGCNQIPPRSTMPIRGLRDTAPFHWDGVPGDPFGGRNGEFPGGGLVPNCDLDDPESCTRHLIDGAMASTMCDLSACTSNDEGKPGLLSAAERDAMARFLLSVPHPPARERAHDDRLSSSAIKGFDDFFLQDPPAGSVSPTCGSVGCHNMPFWTGTNIPGSGMDAPSFRGLQDRWLVLPQGRINMWELINPVLGSKGFDEFTIWTSLISGSTADEWRMFVEGSMGYPGAVARQITLNELSASDPVGNEALLGSLEQAAVEGTLLLQGDGIRLIEGSWQALSLTFDSTGYHDRNGSSAMNRSELLDMAASGDLLVTLTGRLPKEANFANPQPAIWSTQNIFQFTKIAFPRLRENQAMRIKGRHIAEGASVFVNGRKVGGSVRCESGTLPACSDEVILVELEQLPADFGMHFLQVQTPDGLLSNEYLFFVI